MTSFDATPPIPPGHSPGAPRRTRRFLGHVLRRFRRSQDGATAVEFGLVALPFFALLFAIMETALTFWSTQVLETAVADTARLVYTGQFQASAGTASAAELGEKFRKELCTRVVALFDCNAMVKIDVRTFTAFPDATVGLPINNGQFDTADFGYRASGPNEIVVVRAAMEYPVFTSLLNSAQGNLANGKRLIMASATFRNEPFGQ